MRRGVIIIIVGLLLIALTIVAWVVWGPGLGGAPAGEEPETKAGEAEPTAEATATLANEVQLLVAVQEIPRGMVIEKDASGNYPVQLRPCAVSALPDGAIIAAEPGQFDETMLPPGAVVGGSELDNNVNGVPDVIDYVIGKQLRSRTVLNEPILDTMLNDKGRIDVSGEGSDVALAAPQDKVVIAFPLPSIDEDPTAAVAYALRPGDHVDLIISLALVDLDEQFHTILPNTTELLNFAEDTGQLQLVEFPTGRIEQGPLGLTFNIVPSEDQQRARMVTQLTVQDVIVMRVGRYPTLEEEILGLDMQVQPEPTATPAVAPTPEATAVPQQGQQQAPEQPTPTPEPPMPEVIVLAVSPQEALVINYAWQINAKVNFALRAVGDEGVYFTTNSVTLQYLMEQYNIAVPPKMQYGTQPAVREVQEFVANGGE